MAAELGFTEGIPLVSGAGDKVAGCLGAGIVDYGDTILKLHLTAKSAPVYRNIDRIWKNADWMFCHRRFQVTSMRHTLLQVQELH